MLAYEHLLQQVWGQGNSGALRPMRTVVRALRHKLGDDANSPTYIFTDLPVGYRMPKGEAEVDRRGEPWTLVARYEHR